MSAAIRWPLHRPVLGAAEAQAVAAVLESGRLVQGPHVEALEGRAAALVGRRHGVAVSSGTAALHLAILAAGCRPGDEVLVPAFGFPATANAVEVAGGHAVAADVDPDTFALTPESVEARVTPRTVGVVVVHAFGIPAPMEAIEAVARRRGLWWVEDAACSLGTEPRGRWGRPGGTSCVSLHPRKTVTSGEGGLLLTDDDATAHRLRVLRNQGVDPAAAGWSRFVEAGFNYRLSELHAAVGEVQLGRLAEIVAQRRRVAAWYHASLADRGLLGRRLRWPGGYAEPALNVQSLVVELGGDVDRDAVIGAMRERGVETTIGGYNLAEQPYYVRRRGLEPAAVPTATRLGRQALTLPVTHAMNEADVAAVVTRLAGCLDAQRAQPRAQRQPTPQRARREGTRQADPSARPAGMQATSTEETT